MSLTLDPTEFTDAGTVEMDKRGRGAIVKPSELDPNVKYRKYVGKRGEIVLMPVVEVPAHEAWLFNNHAAPRT